ncbi:MAG: hypothetical protein ACPGLV_11765, partial [Bacteroidia bacterium]
VVSAGGGFLAAGNLGFKLAASLLTDSILDGNLSYLNLGPFYAKAEYAISDKSGLGINVAYIANNVTWNDELTSYKYTLKRSNISIMARYNYYFMTRESFELYGGLGVGGRLSSWAFESDDPTFVDVDLPIGIPFAFEATVGFRAYPVESVAIYGEFGGAKSLVQLGIALKL